MIKLLALHCKSQNGNFVYCFQMLNINDDRFKWSQETQAIIKSSFNWGYVVAMLPSGILVQKFDGKLVLLVSLFLSAIIIVLTPLAVAYGT